MKIDKVTKLINLAMILLVLLFMCFLVWYDINPAGQRTVEHSFNKPHSLVRGPYPDDRLIGTLNKSNEYWQIAIDPVYFDLYIPRLYQRIIFTSIFKLSSEQTVLELGGLGSDQGWQVTLKPAYNGYLESLNLNCQNFIDAFSQVAVCAGRESLPSDLKVWEDIFVLYPQAQYTTYFFNSEKLENLNVKKWENNLTNEDFDFLITTYNPAEDLGDGWKKATAVFLPEELWLAGHVYKFILSAPDLSVQGDIVKLKTVEFYLEKEPITKNNFFEKLIRFWQRLKLRF
jgi:hypothetical protein